MHLAKIFENFVSIKCLVTANLTPFLVVHAYKQRRFTVSHRHWVNNSMNRPVLCFKSIFRTLFRMPTSSPSSFGVTKSVHCNFHFLLKQGTHQQLLWDSFDLFACSFVERTFLHFSGICFRQVSARHFHSLALLEMTIFVFLGWCRSFHLIFVDAGPNKYVPLGFFSLIEIWFCCW